MKVRTRFAPSPTGFMHVGGVRTAIFAWAFAKQNQGDFILRIEDTDKSREVEGSIQHISDSLKWLGIDWQEGPDVGGPYGPYQQSERLEIYKDWAQKLIDKGYAYADPFTPEQVDEFRKQSQSEKKPFLYREYRPEDTPTPGDWYGNVPIRFRVPEIKRTIWQDEVRGELSAGEEALDDFIIIKADGYPTYNFAHIIDDYQMKISHVMRGEEFISSMPKFISLHEALEIPLPKFVTMPPILSKDGGKKLSKRDGAKDILEYQKEGYLPESIINFLSSLGWNDGTEQELYSTQEFLEKFSLDRVQRKGAHFDDTKLDWIDWQQQVALIETDLPKALELMDFDQESLAGFESAYLGKSAELAVTKSRSSQEFHEQFSIFISQPTFELNNDNLALIDKNLDSERAKILLRSAREELSGSSYGTEEVEKTLRQAMEKSGAQPREYLNLVRWAISGRKVSPNLFDMISVLGKDETLARIDKVLS